MEHPMSESKHRSSPAGTVDGDLTTNRFFHHSSAPRINTDTVIADSLKKQYPNLTLSITPQYSCNLVGFAAAGHATSTPIHDKSETVPESLSWKRYVPPARRLDGGDGFLAEQVVYAKFMYEWQGNDFIVYEVDGRDGSSPFGQQQNFYILSAVERKANELITAVGRWSTELGNVVLVFDGGFWSPNAELYQSVMKASWDAVILDPKMKKALIDDHTSFFDSQDSYAKLKVPWKRGVIYHGPPGNGKTISVKAMMHALYDRKSPVPTLYVRTLASYGGPEYSLKLIFGKARRYAPCYLVFEDLDSIVTDGVRSYFLNEVDGLENNDGIFMVGSTNHLERLDPGISKRPSRFDRKYYFPNPILEERIAYCHFWQRKLKDNKSIKFPDELCNAIAEITDEFSFAYIQEAFVAALLAIARQDRSKELPTMLEKLTVEISEEWVEVLSTSKNKEDPDLENLVLWVTIKEQIKILRESLKDKNPEVDE